ncbi:efflux RND transporter periplasmic adaptor subunit [Desertivirga arenae]|uniref:efflux RND transporter periplasmic adaptor subunit n=1 Tax=Desertivirga arenae TaxID=2810309 RepID=UPI001A974849|nr:efflux RND transporter periplasmic adaptor subunit [Pedobacter sp. SYSU D00823]
MKRSLRDSGLIIFLLLTLIAVSCQQENKKLEEVQQYTCPMHPDVVKETPGSCPVCGMDLVAVHNAQTHGDTLAGLSVDPARVAIGNLKVVKAERTSQVTELKASGVINYNTNSFKSVSSRVAGRIERLYLKYNFQPVRKGQKIMEIYSPDLASAEQELLFLKNSNEPVLLEAAKRKLRLLGVTDGQLNQVLKTGKIDYSVPVYSPYSGYITEVSNSSSSSASGSATGGSSITSDGSGASMGAMGSSAPAKDAVPSTTTSSTPILLKEGQYVGAGQTLFNLVSAEGLWAEFFISPEVSKWMKRGSAVRVQSRALKSKTQRTTVKLIQPFYEAGTNYILARANVDNTSRSWRVGELVDVAVENTQRIGNWLPKTAVLSLGTRYVAFIRRGAVFVPVYIEVKAISENAVDIGGGLDPQTEFAENAWFLVDPESFIKPQSLK